MEPMTLGSPAQSPKNNPMNFTQNSAYLPGYLLGEQQNNAAPRHGSLSPTKSRPGLFKSPEMLERTLTPQSNQFHTGIYQNDVVNSPLSSKQKVTEKSGPPVQGLFDTLESRYKHEPRESHSDKNLNYSRNPSFDSFQNNTFMSNPDEKLTSTPKRVTFGNRQNPQDQSYRPSDPLSNETWVTVLGFPSSTNSIIMAHFAQCGTIVDKKFPAQGNWVHIRYSNQYEANKALAFNGKVLGGNIMVGVLPYRPQELGNKENLSCSESLQSSFSNNLVSPPRPLRLLAQPYLSPHENNTSLNEITSPIPQKSTGMVTKAMEYVFGW